MARITVENAFDLHINSHPALFKRIGDDIELERISRDSAMYGIYSRVIWKVQLAGLIIQ